MAGALPLPGPASADAGIWRDRIWTDSGDAESLFDSLLCDEDDESLGTKQLAADSSSAQDHHHAQADADPSPSGTADSSSASMEQSLVAPAYAMIQQEVEPAANSLTTEPNNEDLEIAKIVRVAAQCGDDADEGRVWSEEEQKELLVGLNLYAMDDARFRCFKIASRLPKKTTVDVALRCRWLQDKQRKTTKRAEPAQKNSVKGTKMVKINQTMYPLSKEALNSRSTKELIEDNDVLLKLIEENIKKEQMEDNEGYFDYVKTNMDAIVARRNGVRMGMPPSDEQHLEQILRAPHNSSLALLSA